MTEYRLSWGQGKSQSSSFVNCGFCESHQGLWGQEALHPRFHVYRGTEFFFLQLCNRFKFSCNRFLILSHLTQLDPLLNQF